jgi:hypothetical protein
MNQGEEVTAAVADNASYTIPTPVGLRYPRGREEGIKAGVRPRKSKVAAEVRHDVSGREIRIREERGDSVNLALCTVGLRDLNVA